MSTTYVVGAGGIGCAVASGLLMERPRTVVVEKDERKIAWGRQYGIEYIPGPIDGGDDELSPQPAEFEHFRDWHPKKHDTVYLCVKCFDNAEILERLSEGVELIPVQNGYDDRLEMRSHQFEAIASFVARTDPGTTRFAITRRGHLHIGSRTGHIPHAAHLFVTRYGVPTKTVDDIRPIKAAKLMYNAAISPLAAAAGIDNGVLLLNPVARRLFFRLLQENYEILNAANVPLGKVGPFHPSTVSRILKTPGLARVMAKFFVRSLRGTYCSMAGDIEKGRTELDNYNGHLLRLAEGKHPAPINRAIMDLIPPMRATDVGILASLEAHL